MTDTHYVKYSWVSKSYPTEDYGTFTGIISELCIQTWWLNKQGGNGRDYHWILDGVNKV